MLVQNVLVLNVELETSLPGLAMPLATVYADGQQEGSFLWPPYAVKLPINGDQKPFELELECVIGMKNTLGPWHWDTSWQKDALVGPGGWMTE